MSQASSSQLPGESTPVYNILQNDQIGKYLTANKDLVPGEEILTELPFVVGPKASTYPLCLSCYTPWPPSPDDDQPLCSKCRWPVCNDECSNAPQHRDYECQIFAAVGEKFNITAALEDEAGGIPQLECITPLRLLLASEKFSERWNKEVKEMEAHNKKRCAKSQWKTDHVNIVLYLRDRLKLDKFTEEMIQTACGILEVNCHEVRTSSGYTARALYPKIALMNHSCVCNTSYSVFTNDYRVQLRSAVRIPKGGELFGSYTHALLPTLLRREQLLESKHFICACSRCSDPTEMGTHMSSLKCNKCDNGVVISLDSLDAESSWKCTHCDFSTSGGAIKKVFDIIYAAISSADSVTIDEGPEAIHIRENVIKKYHSVLHPRHSFLTILRLSLSQLYGRVEEYGLDDLPDVVLEHKVDTCRLLLQVLDVVVPGYSRERGMTLYELHAPLLFLAKTQWTSGVINEAGLKSKMSEVENILKEAAAILCLEPPESAEGQIAIAAKESLRQLEESINNL